MNLAELLIENLYLLVIPLGVIAIAIISILHFFAFKKEKDTKKYKIANILAVIMTVVTVVLIKILSTKSGDEIYFGYKELGIDLTELEESERKSSTVSSPFGTIYRWTETAYHDNSKKNVKLEFELLMSENTKIVDSYVKEWVDIGFKDVYGSWGQMWKANEVYYYYENGDTTIEQWLVLYDDMVFKVRVNNMNFYEDVIKKTVSYLDKHFGKSSTVKDGVYYQAINPKPIYNKNICGIYEYTLLEYDGRVYVSNDFYSTSIDGSIKVDIDSMIGEELCTVYQNVVGDYSTDKEKIKVVEEKTLYKVNGYDEEFRVCIFEEFIWDDGTSDKHIRIYQCLNDIIMKKGQELFEDKLHLSDSKYVRGSKFEQSYKIEPSMKDEEVTEFLAALNEGALIDPEATDFPELKTYTSYEVEFLDKNGIDTDMVVYPEGYVIMENKGSDDVVVKVDAEKCNSIIKLIDE